MSTQARITEVKIRRFQSLLEADVVLGGLTVVTGPSNSGKSAFGRALRALARNTAGSQHVSHGHKAAAVIVETEDGRSASIERGKASSTYRLIDEHGHEDIYAKSGTSVPEDVAKWLAVPEGEVDVHFTTQFDGPYLLNVTGSMAQKVLGSLTNVTLLAEASREANRRRSEAGRTAQIRRQDATEARQRLRSTHADLPARKALVVEARRQFESLRDAVLRADRLESLAERVTTAQSAAEDSRATAARLAQVLSQVLPQLEQVEFGADRLEKVEALTSRHEKAKRAVTAYRQQAVELSVSVVEAEATLSQELSEMGVCPLCLR